MIIKWHRRLGWAAGIGVVVWGMSGLLHPVMTWTNPKPAAFMPPPLESFAAPSFHSVQSALEKNEIENVAGLRILKSGDAILMQVTQAERPEKIYVDLNNGKIVEDADKERAVFLARYYTGQQETPVKSARLITEFSNNYPYINRYLPAWEVTFERADNLAAYVETGADRLGSITDRRKVILQTLFQTIHTGNFLRYAEPLRLIVIGGLVSCVLLMAFLGVGLLFVIRRKKRAEGARRWHRALGFVVWIPLIMFPASGIFHLIKTSPLFYEEVSVPVFAVSAVDIEQIPDVKNAEDVRLIPVQDGRAWWRVQAGENVQYSWGGQRLTNDSFARLMAGFFEPGAQVASSEKITMFSNEYGFAYKRLPVWRVSFEDASLPVLFIEPRTATLAARVNKTDASETWSFSNFHKWQFLDGFSHKMMGHNFVSHFIRDIIMIVFVLLSVISALAGMRILLKSAKKKR
jgi:hypothetical protein